MKAKITLVIEEEIIEKAKKYARENGRSLSGIIENYLKIITQEEEREHREISPLVKSLKGSFKAPEDFDMEKELTDGLSEKYL